VNRPWVPASPCGPKCLSGKEETVGRVRVAGRLLHAAGVLVAALGLALARPLLGPRGRERVVRWTFRALLRAFGIRLAVFNAAGLAPVPGRGALVVNNRISWLDIVAINAVRPMRALAKREVRGWPVLGRLTRMSGTIYVDRERLRTLPGAVTEVAGALRAGSMVNVTPEGTTWCGQAGGRYRPAAFQAALDAGVPVVPVALRFRTGDGRETTAPAFIGDEGLIDSVRRVARLRGLVLEVHVLAEIAPGRAADRRELAALAEEATNSALGRARLPRPRRSRPVVGDHAGISTAR
jgi:1-acyl-sn-glycerol-3-phosphate acyltransferase